MKVRDGMSQVVLSVGPAHTLRQAAKMMSVQRVGAAVVVDHERSGIGILTERDILNSLGSNQDPDAELVFEGHTTVDAIQLNCRDYERLERPRRLAFSCKPRLN